MDSTAQYNKTWTAKLGRSGQNSISSLARLARLVYMSKNSDYSNVFHQYSSLHQS